MPPNTTSDSNLNENPNKDLKIPEWINEQYFQGILERHEPNFKTIQKFSRMAATAPGENYTSIMVRVKIDIEAKDGANKQVSFIVKTSFDATNTGAEFVNNLNLFPKEVYVYRTVLPEYEKLYKAVGVDIQFGPKCYNLEETPERITLVMEDLGARKFVNMDRLNGLDFAHTEKLLRKLGELHAASVVLYNLNGPFDEMFNQTFYQESNREVFKTLSKEQETTFKKSMNTWGLDNVDYYITKLPDSDKAFEHGLALNKVDDDEFNVLNHGDCWTNNFMFSHDQHGVIEETLFVDFQVGHWGSPAQDLWYFILSSTHADIRVANFDQFIHIYHKRLVECLKLLKYPKEIITLKELHIKLLKHSFWTSMATSTVMPAVLFPSDKDANIENFLNPGPEGEELRERVLTNPNYTNAMKQIYPFLDNKGILDL